MKPLTTRQRSTSLIILGILFVIIAPVIVLYSLGYTLDDTFTFKKTGGIFIHSDVSNTSVFVDKEFFKSNGIFIKNTLIQDLSPNKKYLIEVYKEGYQSWIKEIYVYPSIVSEGSVLMMPNEFQTREIFKYIDEDQNATSTPIIKTQVKPTNPEFISISELFGSSTKQIIEKPVVATATSTASTTTKKQKSDIEIFFEELQIKNYEKLNGLIVNGEEVSWIQDGNINLYWIDDIASIPYYYCDGEEERVCTNKIVLDWKNTISKFEYIPGRSDAWIVLTQDGIYAVEVDGRTERNIQNIYKGDNLDFRLTQTDRLIIKKGSSYFEINL
jgi:hypothetical protein